jgi:hypothetical protein
MWRPCPGPESRVMTADTSPFQSGRSRTAARPRLAPGVALFAVTASLVFFVTGVGMFEGRVVYPSWLDLATFGDFAAYHTDYGRSLLPWLPGPLLVATVLNVVLLRRRPGGVPRWALIATLAAQLFIVGVTAGLAVPLQAQLGTAGHSPVEIHDMVERLIRVNTLREVPGLAVAAAFGWMLYRVLLPAGRPAHKANDAADTRFGSERDDASDPSLLRQELSRPVDLSVGASCICPPAAN